MDDFANRFTRTVDIWVDMLKVPTHRPHGAPDKAEAHRVYDQRKRNKVSKRFYNSYAWIRLRLVKLTRTPYCEPCHAASRLTSANTVHHRIPIEVDPALKLDIDNLESICSSCHARLHKGKPNG